MSNWTSIHCGNAAGFGMPTFGGLAVSAYVGADFGAARERIAVVAMPKRTPGTSVWSPPT